MSSKICLHDVLNTDVLNFESIQKVLERDPSCVNKEIFWSNGSFQRLCPPLHFVLLSKNCSVDVVKLLLKYGANVNYKDKCGRTSLYLSLCYARKGEVARVLIENGAIADNFQNSSLCAAFGSGSSKDVIEILLEVGCSMSACMDSDHSGSSLHCATQRAEGNPVSTEVLQMLVERGASVNAVNGSGESVLCYALQNQNETHTIQWLLDAGGSCDSHTSLFHCATASTKVPFKTSVVELLLGVGACPKKINLSGMMPLQNVLLKFVYEYEAVALLLDSLNGVDLNRIVKDQRSSLLHLAVKNKHCIPNVVELLIQRGVKGGTFNICCKTAFDVAIETEYSSLTRGVFSDLREVKIIEVLLRNGAKVSTEHVMRVVQRQCCNTKIVMLLLNACATVSQPFFNYLLKLASKKMSKCRHQIDCLKYLIKCYFLRFSDYDKFFLNNVCDYSIFKFKQQCVQELLRMKSKEIGRDHTLHDFLHHASNRQYDFDSLLDAIGAFPVYFDFIAEKVGKPPMENKLQDLQVYYVKFTSSEKVFFNYEILLNISQYLNDNDLLTFIVTFLNVRGQASNAQDIKGKKRKAEYYLGC